MTTPQPQPVYSGLVVTLFCADSRTGRDYTRTVPEDRLTDALKRVETNGDRLIYQGQPHMPTVGVVPLATAKTPQQEKDEKAAAKLVSKNQQAAAVRARNGETRRKPAPPKPVVPALATKRAKPAVRATTKAAPVPAPAPVKKATHNARPVVCLSSGTYYASVQQAEDASSIKRTTLFENLKRNAGWGKCKGRVYDYATAAERAAGRCLRSAPPTDKLISRYQGTRAKAFLIVTTGELYERLNDLIAAKHISRRWISTMQPGETRQTPLGPVQQLSAQAAAEWRVANPA